MATPPSPRKRRCSCDGCGAAKVRCDRGHPHCNRCTTLGIACVYGPSRQSGKPPRKRLAENIERPPEKRTRQGVPDIQPALAPAPTPTPLTVNSDTANVPPSLPPHDFNPLIDIADTNQLATTTFYPAFSFEDWSQLDNLDAGLGIQSPSALLDTLHGASNSRNFNNADSHSCRRESYEIFRDLICPSPSIHAPESNSATVSAPLDHILSLNRSATCRLSRLLKCPCAKSGHRAMVHASVVSRILIWYQQAAECSTSAAVSASHGSLSPTSSSPSESSPPELPEGQKPSGATSLVQSTGFTVDYVPISVGDFDIDDWDLQSSFRVQLVLSELKKLAAVIDMFIIQEPRDISASGVSVDGLYSHLGSWLRSEHSRTVLMLRAKLQGHTEAN